MQIKTSGELTTFLSTIPKPVITVKSNYTKDPNYLLVRKDFTLNLSDAAFVNLEWGRIVQATAQGRADIITYGEVYNTTLEISRIGEVNSIELLEDLALVNPKAYTDARPGEIFRHTGIAKNALYYMVGADSRSQRVWVSLSSFIVYPWTQHEYLRQKCAIRLHATPRYTNEQEKQT